MFSFSVLCYYRMTINGRTNMNPELEGKHGQTSANSVAFLRQYRHRDYCHCCKAHVLGKCFVNNDDSGTIS